MTPRAVTRPGLAPAGAGPALFLVAGEVSGDIYGSDLVAALRARRPDLTLVGVGGPRMAAAGCDVLLDTTAWGVIGWAEALVHLPAFLLRLRRVERLIRRVRPAVLVLIDFPGFNLVLAHRLRGAVPIAYFLPPMVSTRRGDRARRIAALGLHLLPAFTFEAEAYRSAAADAVFVGHPVLDRVRPPDSIEAVRARLGLGDGPTVALLPGSRWQELRRHLPVMARALGLAAEEVPGLQAVVLVAAAPFHPWTARTLDRSVPSGIPVRLVPGGTPEGYAALGAADFAVVCSGTATLEAMVLGVPMVIVYRLSRTTWWVARRLAAVGTAGLPSLVAGRPVVPELLQEALTPQRLAAEMVAWLRSPGRRAEMREALLALRDRLGPGGAAGRAAEAILGLVETRARPHSGVPSLP